MKYIFLVFLLLPSLANANTEISTPGTNISIGTTDTTNALGIASTLAVGGSTYTETAAPANGALIQGNVGIGSLNPGTALDVAGTVRATSFVGSAASLTSFPTLNQNTTGNAATVTTNANLTGPIASSGNATSITSQTGTGTKFVVDTAPTIATSLTASYATATTPAVFNGSKNLVSGSYSGNTTEVVTTTGSQTSGDCVKIDANGNHIDAGSACGSGGSGTNYWALGTGGNIGIGTTNNVSIGTLTGNAALDVMGGNVGIGSVNPISLFQVNGGDSRFSGGNVGIDASQNINSIIPGYSQMLISQYGDQTSFYADGSGVGMPNGNEGFVNIGIGQDSLTSDTMFSGFNVALGQYTLYMSTSSSDNIAIGYVSLQSLTDGSKNVAIGPYSLVSAIHNIYNIGVGYYSLEQLVTGNNNTALGEEAGWEYGPLASQAYLSSVSNSIFLGEHTNALANGDTNEAVIGYDAVGSGSNTITLGNSSNVATVVPFGGLVVGNVGLGTVVPNGSLIVATGNVGIGSLSPGTTLDVTGTARMTGFQLGTTATSGYVLTANSSGVGTYQPSSGGVGTNYWTNVGAYLYNNTGTNVGIGTVNPTGALEVEGGNVGIGTSTPAGTLAVNGSISNALLNYVETLNGESNGGQ